MDFNTPYSHTAQIFHILPYICVALVALIFIGEIVRRFKRHKRVKAYRKAGRDKTQSEWNFINSLINNINITSGRLMGKAVSLEDEVLKSQVQDIREEAQRLIDDFRSRTFVTQQDFFSSIYELRWSLWYQLNNLLRLEDECNGRKPKKKKTDEFSIKDTKYFSDCVTKADCKKRFRELAKKYHPDNPNGDSVKYMEMDEEYKKICEKLSA